MIPKLLAGAMLGLAVLASPADAQEAQPKPPLADVTKPFFIIKGAPLCLSENGLDEMMTLYSQGAMHMATRVEGCFSLGVDRRAYVLGTSGWFPVKYRLRFDDPSGRTVDVWTLIAALKNGDPEPAGPASPPPRRRGA